MLLMSIEALSEAYSAPEDGDLGMKRPISAISVG